MLFAKVLVFILLVSITGTLALDATQGRLLRKQRDGIADSPLLVGVPSDITPEDSVTFASQGFSAVKNFSPFVKPTDTITVASLEAVFFLYQLDGLQKYDNATLKKN
jgi:hypothetical protein